MTKTIPTKSPAYATLAAELFQLAGEFHDFANEWTESLSFEEYDNIVLWEAKLLAYGNLLSTIGKVAFLEAELKEARHLLEDANQRRS